MQVRAEGSLEPASGTHNFKAFRKQALATHERPEHPAWGYAEQAAASSTHVDSEAFLRYVFWHTSYTLALALAALHLHRSASKRPVETLGGRSLRISWVLAAVPDSVHCKQEAMQGLTTDIEGSFDLWAAQLRGPLVKELH